MPKGSPELTERRKKEIIDACEEIYKSQGFSGVTIKEISTRTSFSRPAIYNYFETKEEILLALLVREYRKWIGDLKAIIDDNISDRDTVATAIAHSLEDRNVLLRIQNMNLFEIEENSRIERLSEFKNVFFCAFNMLFSIIKTYALGLGDEECKRLCYIFFAFLYGVYPYTSPSLKQKQAMDLVGIEFSEISIYEMIYLDLIRILPPDCNSY